MRTFDCPACTLETRRFGRGKSYHSDAERPPSNIADDLRLFALTFAGGFLFMTVFLA